jgi:iduronate 2-sulfatase
VALTVALLLAGAWLPLLSSAAASTEKRMNVLFLVVDDLRPWLGAYGERDAHSPHIDALAAKSLQFNRSYVQFAMCGPSRISFLTSRRPDTTRLWDTGSYWREHAGNFTTLPEAFKIAGYHALSFGKIFHPGKPSGGKSSFGGKDPSAEDDMPWSWSEAPYHPPAQKDKNSPTCGPSIPSQKHGQLYSNMFCPVDPSKEPKGSLPDMQTTAEVLRVLRARREGVDPPAFLAVGYHKPHIPFKFPAKYLDLVPTEAQMSLAHDPEVSPWMLSPPGSVALDTWTDVRSRQDVMALDIPFPYGRMPDNFARMMRRAYLAAIAYTDDQVGQVLAGIQGAGMQDNTIVSLVGDHGWALGEHGVWAKYQVYETATRVPTMIHVPGMASAIAGTSTNNFFELVDLWPTLADLAGISVPPTCPPLPDALKVPICTDGASAAPMLLHSTGVPQKTAAFSQYSRPSLQPANTSDLPDLDKIKYMGHTMRTPTYRYTEWRRFTPSTYTTDWSGPAVARELYDHGAGDSGEDNNLCFNNGKQDCGENASLADALSKQLKAGWRGALPKP